MPTRQRGKASKNARTRTRESFRRTTTVPVASIPWTWNTDFAMSNPTVATRSMMPLPPAQPAITTAGGRRAVHDIKSGPAAFGVDIANADVQLVGRRFPTCPKAAGTPETFAHGHGRVPARPLANALE